jgi:hypothetical protein
MDIAQLELNLTVALCCLLLHDDDAVWTQPKFPCNTCYEIRSKNAFRSHLHLECLNHKSQLCASTTAGNETKHLKHLLYSFFVSSTTESQILTKSLRDFSQYFHMITKEPPSINTALIPFILGG